MGIFVRDRQTDTTQRVSVPTGGGEGNADSFGPVISGDGQTVFFSSYATNLVVGAPGSAQGGTYAHDRTTGTTTYLGFWSYPGVSFDGRFVAFTDIRPLVPGDTNDAYDVFVLDRSTGAFERASVASNGTQANGRAARGGGHVNTK